jgi:hypothetical protein
MLGNANLCRCLQCGLLTPCTDAKKIDGRYKCQRCVAHPPAPPVNSWTGKVEVPKDPNKPERPNDI